MGIIIPKRGYLTFAELRQRWQCTDNDLRYLVVNGEIKPSIKATEEMAQTEWDYDPHEDGCVPSGEVKDAQSMYVLKFRPEYWLYLQWPNQTSAMDCEFRLAASERNPDRPDCPWDKTKSFWFWLPRALSMSDIENEHAFFTMDEVLRYEASHEQGAPPKLEEKPVATRERNTLLAIIAVLCKEAKMEYTRPAKTADLIADTAAKMGIAIGESTIEGHLKKIPDALRARMK